MTKIVDIYCRVSTDIQEDNSSLEEQENCCREYADKNGLIIGAIHREVFTGYQYREREKLAILRKRYKDGIIQGVIIRTLDRLSRSQVHNAILMEEMQHHEIELFCVKEKIDDSPMGQFIRMVLSFVADMEREKIMDRTLTGRINKAKEGKIVSGNKLPYGWKWNNPTTKDFVILHEEQANIIKWMAEQYISGISCYQIVEQLTEKGIQPPSQKENSTWSMRSVMRTITDIRITGKGAKMFFRQEKDSKQHLDTVNLPDGTYPAIISEKEFLQIQKRTEINKTEASRHGSETEEYLLRAGFVKCATCGWSMSGSCIKGRYVYQCHVRPGICKSQRIPSRMLDSKVWEYLQKIANHAEIIEKAIDLATNTKAIATEAKSIENSIQTYKKKIEMYLEDLDDISLRGEIRGEIRTKLNRTQEMLEKLENERAIVTLGMVNKDALKTEYQKILRWCQTVKEARKELTYTEKRDFLRILGVVVLVEDADLRKEDPKYKIHVSLPEISTLIQQNSGEIVRHDC